MSGIDNIDTLDVIREVVIDQIIAVDVTIVTDSLDGAPETVVDLVETPIEGAVGVGTSYGGRVEAGLCVHCAHPGRQGVPGIPSCVHLEGHLTFLEPPRESTGKGEQDGQKGARGDFHCQSLDKQMKSS